MKYIILIILLLISLTLFSKYENKFQEAKEISKFFSKNKFLKENKYFDIEKKYSFTGDYKSVLSGLDLWTIKMLDQDLSGALEVFSDKKIMTYQDYFNKGNILLKLWIDNFNTDENKAEEYLLWAINSYNIIVRNTELNSKIKNDSLENIDITLNLKNLLELKSYIIFLATLTKKTNIILSQIKNLKSIIIEQIQALQEFEKQLKDNDLKLCINNIKKEMVNNYNWLESNESFFQKIKENLLSALEKIKTKKKINKQYMEKKKELKKRFQWSLDTMVSYFKDYYELQWKISDILKSKNEQKLKQLCKEQQDKQKNNKNLEDAYQNLSELLNQQQQQQEEWQKSQASGTNEIHHFDLSDQEIERYSERIEQENQKWIKQIQKRKNSEDYNPAKLLDELFKKFMWEDKDFRNQEIPNINWTNSRNW